MYTCLLMITQIIMNTFFVKYLPKLNTFVLAIYNFSYTFLESKKKSSFIDYCIVTENLITKSEQNNLNKVPLLIKKKH